MLGKHEAAVLSVKFSPNSQCVASGSVDKSVKIFNLFVNKQSTIGSL